MLISFGQCYNMIFVLPPWIEVLPCSIEINGQTLNSPVLSVKESSFLLHLPRVSFLLSALLPKLKVAAIRSDDFLDRTRQWKSQKNPQLSGEKRMLTPVHQITVQYQGLGLFSC